MLISDNFRSDVRVGIPTALAIAFILPVLVNSLTHPSSAADWMILVLQGIGLCIALFAYRWILVRPLYWLAAMLLPVSMFCEIFLNSAVTPGILASVEATNVREAYELIHLHLDFATLTVIYVLLCILGAIKAHRLPNPFTTRRLLIALAVCLVCLPVACGVWFDKDVPGHRLKSAWIAAKYTVLARCFPLDIAYSQYGLIKGRREVRAAEAQRRRFRFDGVSRESHYNGPEVYVVVIGESSRRASWSLFGYGRNTNPLLTSLPAEEAKGLYTFDRVRSNANITILSLPLALTRATPRDTRPLREEKSIVSLAAQAGFETYWISTQEEFGGFADPVTAIAMEAKHVSFIGNRGHRGMFDGMGTGAYDEDLIGPLANILSEDCHGCQEAIFIHTMGSHENYRARVPAGRQSFSRLSLQKGDVLRETQERISAYDDSILYTDYVVGKMIDLLASLKYPAALIYFSDHGERMFCENSPVESFSHGFTVPAADELAIPVLLWAAAAYAREYPSVIEAAARNQHLETSLDAIFDTIADLMRIEFARTDPNYSLLNPAPIPAPRDVLAVDESLRTADAPLANCQSVSNPKISDSH
ncbi:MAG TPA: sulfatase-like hydrolase/transferase [Candidatus Acidoferrales bacterium]|nr:sulfatase-like hydrolase/transferase [Candidatus Acidoferrales bacterium]